MIKTLDCVEIEYNAYDSETKAMFDTTSDAVAKKNGLSQEGKKFKPIKLIVGKNFIVQGLDESLIGKKEGDSYTINIPSAKGFGVWTSKLTENIKLNVFTEKKINPVRGMFVNIDNRMAKVAFVSNRVVKVDYNHPLSGKDLIYEVKVTKMLNSDAEKIECFINNLLGDSFKVNIKGEEVKINSKIEVPEQLKEMLKKELKEMLKKDCELVFEKN